MTPTCRDISFNAAMLASVQAGTKTQTRRLMRPQPIPASELGDEEYDGPTQYFVENGQVHTPAWYGSFPAPCPYGQPGDRLRIQEDPSSLLKIVSVRAEQVQSITEDDARAEGIVECEIPSGDGWPARIGYMVGPDEGKSLLAVSAVAAFRVLLTSIYPTAWDNNEWVWVIEFKRITP